MVEQFQGDKEKLDFLKRDEVRTMEKDIAKLRRKEVEQERKRIADIKIEQVKKGEEERLAKIKAEQEKKEEERKRLADIKAEQDRKDEEKRLKEGKRLAKIKAEQEKKEEEKRFKEQERLIKVKVEQDRKDEERRLKEEKQLAKVKVEETEEEKKTQLKEEERLAKIKIEQVKEEEKHQLPTIDRAQISITPEAKTPQISASRSLSQEQKTIIRVIIGFILIFFLINAGLFLYWWYFIKQGVQLESTDQNLVITQPVTLEPTPPSETTIQPFEIIDRLLSFGFEVSDTPRFIDTIIIHSVYAPLSDNPLDVDIIIDLFKSYGVASHYLISQEGTMYRIIKDENIAYHAGASKMPDGRTNISLFSIGIELIHLDTTSPTDAQYRTLAQLVKELSIEYTIPSENILGHQEISPTRKTDPWNFDWDFFRSLLE